MLDLSTMPHLLIAGATGAGKSSCINAMITSILMRATPEAIRLILIDPKRGEMGQYAGVPHLLTAPVTDPKKAANALHWAVREMERRYDVLSTCGYRDVSGYNAAYDRGELAPPPTLDGDGELLAYDRLPFILVIVDELSDLMMVAARDVEESICRLAQMARAVGIHLVVATQRPSVDVITGVIKANIPARLAFAVSSLADSRVILDEGGAESLLANGDFLYRPPGSGSLVRGQGAFVSEREVREICEHLREHGKPEFLEELVQMRGPSAAQGAVDDPLYEEAVRVVLQSGRGSASLLQRALSVGYTRASRLIDIMTEQGVLGPFIGSKAREVLVTLEEWEAQQKPPQ